MLKVVEKVKKLDLPPGQYVVVSSGVLDVLGIREAQDIDIAVTPELFEKLHASGEWQEITKYNKLFLQKDNFDIIRRLDWEAYPTTVHEAIASATMKDGVPFMNLHELKKFKTALGRDKDFADIVLIDRYLQAHPEL